MQDKDNAYTTLTQNDFIKINYNWYKYLGVETTSLLFTLLNQENYWITTAGIDPNGWFFSTDENLQKIFPWSSNTIRNHINRLVKLNIIKTENRGLPKKRWVKINRNLIYWLSDKVATNNQEILTQCTEILKSKDTKTIEYFMFQGEKYYT